MEATHEAVIERIKEAAIEFAVSRIAQGTIDPNDIKSLANDYGPAAIDAVQKQVRTMGIDPSPYIRIGAYNIA